MNRKRVCIGIGAVLFVLLAAAGSAAAYAYHVFHAQGQYFDSNGVRINYFDKGRGTPVILVHGLGINAQANWMVRGIFDHLAEKYRVIALDNRGHGSSGKPHDASQYGPEMAEDIVRLMDHLKIEKAHVVGYSMGGFIVIKLISMHPDRLLSAAPCGAGWTTNPAKDLAFVDNLADALDRGEGFGGLLTFLQPVGQKPNRVGVAFTDIAMRTVNDVPAVMASLRGMKGLMVSEAELRANKVPTLAVIGSNDPLKAFADQLAGVMSNLEYVVVPEANHLTTLMKPESLKTFDRFLAAHTPSGPDQATTSAQDGISVKQGEPANPAGRS